MRLHLCFNNSVLVHKEIIVMTALYDIIDIQEYFEKITKRAIDIVEPAGLCNPYRRAHILKTKEILYAA